MKTSSNIKVFAAILFLLMAYWPLSSGLFTMKFDMMDWFFPMRFLIGECLQNHVLPVWNPYTNLGYPLHLDPQSGALYPVTWAIGYFLGYGLYMINIEFLLHILFAFWGMKKLSEELGLVENIALLVGLSYACCGFFVGNAQHLTWIISATWIPYIFRYYIKLVKYDSWKDSFGLSLFCFLLLTGGYPAFSIILFYLLLIAFFVHSIRLLTRRSLKKARLFLVNNALFSALFLLQGLCFLVFLKEGLPFIIRGETLSLSEAQLFPFSPQSLLSLFLPFSTGGDTAFFQTDLSMANGYIGLTALVFCAFSLFRKLSTEKIVLWVAGLFFLFVAMGEFTFLHTCLHHYVPMMDLFKYPALFRLFVLLAFLLLSGYALQWFWEGKTADSDWKKLRGLIVLFLALFGTLFVCALFRGYWIFPEDISTAALSAFFSKTGFWETVLIQAPFQIAFLFCLLMICRKKAYLVKYLPYLLAIDLFCAVQLNTFLTVAEGTKLASLRQKLDKEPKGFPVPLKPPGRVSHSGNGEFLPIWFNNNILKKQIAHDGYNNFKLKNYRSLKEKPNHMELLGHPVLHWEKPDSSATVDIGIFRPNYLQARIYNPAPGELIFLQSDYPGWQLRLDGQIIRHYRKHAFFIASKIPAGSHTLELFFHPRRYTFYLLVSFGTFTICLIISLEALKKRKHQVSESPNV